MAKKKTLTAAEKKAKKEKAEAEKLRLKARKAEAEARVEVARLRAEGAANWIKAKEENRRKEEEAAKKKADDKRAVEEAAEMERAAKAAGDPFIIDPKTGEVTYIRLPSIKEALASGHNIVWRNWDLKNQFSVLKTLLEAQQQKHQDLFRQINGAPGRLHKTPTDISLEKLEPDAWHAELHERAEFRSFNTKKGTSSGVAADANLIRWVRGLVDIPFLKTLRGFISTPIFDADGTLVLQRGYIPALELYLDVEPGKYLPVPEEVTANDVKEALALLMETMQDIPFSDNFAGTDLAPYKLGDWQTADTYLETNQHRGRASRWNALAVLVNGQLTHLLPPGEGLPIGHSDKASPGEGSTLLAKIAHIVGHGTPGSIHLWQGITEFEKAMALVLLKGDTVIGIDNVSGFVESNGLAGVTTGDGFEVRRYGTNDEFIRVKTRTLMLFGGNNVTFSRQLAERVLPMRLDAGLGPRPAAIKESKPSVFHKHTDNVGWVMANRPQLVRALHILIRAWFQAGKPRGKVRHPRLPRWSELVGGVLENAAQMAGVECHFLRNLDAYMNANDEAADKSALAWVEALVDKNKNHLDRALTAQDMVQALLTPLTNQPIADVGLKFDSMGKVLDDARVINRVIRDVLLRKTHTLADGRRVKVDKRNATRNVLQYEVTVLLTDEQENVALLEEYRKRKRKRAEDQELQELEDLEAEFHRQQGPID
jgi:hypothetical protein